MKNFNIFSDVDGIVFGGDGDTSEGFAIDHILRIVISELGSRPGTLMSRIQNQERGRNVPNYSFTKPFFDNLAFFGDSKDDGEGQTILCWNKTAELFAEGGW